MALDDNNNGDSGSGEHNVIAAVMYWRYLAMQRDM